jgi:hypothetical protein
MSEARPIFRAPMRARTLELPPGAGAEHGLRHGVVGIGEGDGAKAERMLWRFSQLPEGTLVWTRDAGDAYHLGRIAGPWRYDDSDAALAVGLPHVRPARWLDGGLGEDDVPVAVVDSFSRGGRNLQRIHGAPAEQATVALWEGCAQRSR